MSKSLFKQMFSEMPLAFRIWFVVVPMLGLGLTGFIVWAIYRLVMAHT